MKKNLILPHNVFKGKLSLEPDEKPSKAEVEIARVFGDEVRVELRVDHLLQLNQLFQLFLHSALIQIEVPAHPLHEAGEAPERVHLVAHHVEDRRE